MLPTHERKHENKFCLNKKEAELLNGALIKCGDMIDIQGWRYSKDIGINEYQKIDVEDIGIQYQFSACLTFLYKNFSKPHNRDTVNSMDLREGVEIWWYNTQGEKLYIDNGIMLLAIVATELCSPDLWYSMEHYQQARIPPNEWYNFCDRYDYKTQIKWDVFVHGDFEEDIVKIN